MEKINYFIEMVSDYTGYETSEAREINYAAAEAKAELQEIKMRLQTLDALTSKPQAENQPDWCALYHEMRKITDGGCESMTHEDAIAWMKAKDSAGWRVSTADDHRFKLLALFLDPNTYIYGAFTPVDYLEECGDSELYALRKCIDDIEKQHIEEKNIKEWLAKNY